MIGSTRATARRLRERSEALIEGPFEELWIGSWATLGERLLREHAEAAGLDPFFDVLGPAERLAMLLDRLDQLPLRRHEIRGNPAGLLARLLARIDALKADRVGPTSLAEQVRAREAAGGDEAAREEIRRELEFAELYTAHDRILAEAGSLDRGDVFLALDCLFAERPDVRRAGSPSRFEHVMVDELEEATRAQRALLESLRRRSNPNHLYALEGEARGGARLVRASCTPRARWSSSSAACATPRSASGPAPTSAPRRRRWPARSSTWLAAGTDPGQICVLVADAARDGGAVAAAMEERGIPFHLAGPTALFQRPEVRDAIAWLRVLADPDDSAAAARALTRPPVELRSGDLARLTTIARRRKLDMVGGCEAALDSPQFQPEARERIQAFLKLYSAAAAAMEERRADVFVRRLIERVGLRRQRLFAAQPEVAERLLGLSRLAELATAWARREPHGSTRGFVAYLSAVAEAGVEPAGGEEPPAPGAVLGMSADAVKGLGFDHVFVLGLESRGRLGADRLAGAARARPLAPAPRRGRRGAAPRASTRRRWRRAGAEEEEHEEELFGPAEGLHATYRTLREKVLEASWRAGRELSEPRLDTALDVNRAIARYLELLKLAALAQRPGDEPTAEAIEAVNGLLRQVATPEQQAELDASSLDSYLLDSERERGRRLELIAARDEPSLEAFLPRRGDGMLSLSASDLNLYLTCPLKYKFARVFGIPQEPTINQRFGILIHNVLERFHKEPPEREEDGLRRLMRLFEAGWHRDRVRRQRRRAAVPRPRPRGAARSTGSASGSPRASRSGWSEVRLQGRRAPRARARRPGRPPPRRRLRADRLQDRRAQDRGRAGERPAAGALPARRPRGLGDRGRLRQLLLRARRRQGRGADEARRRRAGRAHGASGRRGDHRPGLRAAPLAERLQLVRLPPDLPARPRAEQAPACAPAAGCRRWRRKRWNSRAIESAEGRSWPSSASRSTCSASIRSTSSSISGLAATARPICSS